MANSKGNATLAILCCTILISILSIFIYQNMITIKKIKNRADTYLCMKKITSKTQKYVDRMELINKSIAISSITTGVTSIFPQLKIISIPASSIKSTLQKFQNIFHLYYINQLRKISGQKCSLNSSLLNLPYKTRAGFLLNRNKIGTSILRKDKWDIYLKKNGIFLKASFQLKKKLNVTVSEGLGLLKEYVGYL